MILFHKIRLKFGHKILTKRLKKTFRNKQVYNLGLAETAGILISTENEADWLENKPFIDFLNDNKIKLTVLIYLKNKNLISYYSQLQKVNYFSKDRLTFFFVPKADFIDKFCKKEFDLLIDLSLNHFFPTTYITALSKAHFKVGLKNEYNQFYDLMIDLGNLKNREVYFEQLKHYLTLLNQN